MSWKSIEKLRIANRDYSGLRYSYEYAKGCKNLDAITGGTASYYGEWATVNIAESIRLKRNEDGKILYRIDGRLSGTGVHGKRFSWEEIQVFRICNDSVHNVLSLTGRALTSGTGCLRGGRGLLMNSQMRRLKLT